MSEVMTIKQLADYLQLSVPSLYQMAQHGKLPAAKVGKHWRFQREVIDEWLRARSTSAPSRILIVDDDELVRHTFQDSLEPLGCQVTLAADGEAGLRLARECRFDLIFVDLIMPGIDGVEVVNTLRERGCEAHLALITAYPDSELLTQVLDQGSITLIRKPIRVGEIQRLAASFLRLSSRRGELVSPG